MVRRIIVLLVVGVLLAPPSTWAGASGGTKMAGRMRTEHVTADRIEAAIRRYLEGRIAKPIEEVAVRLLDPQDPVPVKAGPLTIRVTASEVEAGYGRQRFDVTLLVNARPVEVIKATAEVTAFADLAATTRLIKQDEVIGRDDVAVVRMRIPGAFQDVVTDPGDAIGKRAVRPIRPQTPIPTSSLGQPYLVRKGERVTIEARRGGLLIQAAGITKAMGQIGQFVTVTNQDSGKDVRAQVVGPGVVRVEF